MILLVDDNDERRRNLLIWFRVKGYLVSEARYDELKLFTKPFITVYVNPTMTSVSKIKYSNDTISIFFSERKSVTLPQWSINFNSLKNIYEEVAKIYKEKATFQVRDKIDMAGYACMKNGKFSVGGKDIKLTPTEYKIVCFFLNQPNKKFFASDAARYIKSKEDYEASYLVSISKLNRKLKAKKRPKLIICEDNWCYFNPEIANYVCEDGTENEYYDNHKGPFFLYLDEEF
jgi:hypothetical protein